MPPSPDHPPPQRPASRVAAALRDLPPRPSLMQRYEAGRLLDQLVQEEGNARASFKHLAPELGAGYSVAQLHRLHQFATYFERAEIKHLAAARLSWRQAAMLIPARRYLQALERRRDPEAARLRRSLLGLLKELSATGPARQRQQLLARWLAEHPSPAQQRAVHQLSARDLEAGAASLVRLRRLVEKVQRLDASPPAAPAPAELEPCLERLEAFLKSLRPGPG